MMNENKIIETLKYISQFVENRHDEGLGDYLHIVIGRTDINVIDETIHLLERKQKEIEKKNCLIDVLQHRIEELLDNKKEINYIKPIDIPVHNYISKDKIREIFQFYIERDSLFNDNPHKMAVIRLKDVLEELLEEQ